MHLALIDGSNNFNPNTSIRSYQPGAGEVWQELFASDPEALPYQSPAWLDCICAMGGYEDASRLYETSEGRRLLMPMVRTKGLPAALGIEASLPYAWGMGGLVSADPLEPEDVATVFADLGSRPILRTSIRPNPRTGEIWATASQSLRVVTIPRRAHVLNLDGGFDQVWTKRFKKSTRRAIRKAERSKLVVECDTTGKLVPVFYDLMQKSFDRWARQQHEPLALARWRAQRRDPPRKFQIMAQRLGEACRIWVAWLDGQAVAASVVLQYHNVNDARSAMDKELAAPVCANDLLLKLSIEDACRAGCRYYHLGESGTSAGLSYYKARFGARSYPYAEYRLERLPITRVDVWLRGFAKRLIGFKDT